MLFPRLKQGMRKYDAFCTTENPEIKRQHFRIEKKDCNEKKTIKKSVVHKEYPEIPGIISIQAKKKKKAGKSLLADNFGFKKMIP